MLRVLRKSLSTIRRPSSDAHSGPSEQRGVSANVDPTTLTAAEASVIQSVEHKVLGTVPADSLASEAQAATAA